MKIMVKKMFYVSLKIKVEPKLAKMKIASIDWAIANKKSINQRMLTRNQLNDIKYFLLKFHKTNVQKRLNFWLIICFSDGDRDAHAHDTDYGFKTTMK